MNMKNNILKLRKIVTVFSVIAMIVASQPSITYGYIAGSSASLKNTPRQEEQQDNRAAILRAYLNQYNSPLADKADIFVAEADKYNLDYRLLPSIAGVESWFGTRYPRNTYNGWGYGIYGTHTRYFNSWDDAIHTISKDLREKYMDQWGADKAVIKSTCEQGTIVEGLPMQSCKVNWDTAGKQYVYAIGSKYASDPKWAAKVTHFMNDIEGFESKVHTKAISISL